MKIDRHSSDVGPARTVTIEAPAQRAFSPVTLDEVGATLGAVAGNADRASVEGGDGAASAVDGFVTEAEARRYQRDFATGPSTRPAAALLVDMYTPATSVDVTLPQAVAPIIRRQTLTCPDQAARLSELPDHLRSAAHIALDVVAHIDSGDEGAISRSRFDAHAVVDVDVIAAALAPANLELLRDASNDMVIAPKVVGELEALRLHLTTASTTKDFVPTHPPEYVARLPLKHATLELITFGTLQNMLPLGPAGHPGTTTITPPHSFDGGRVVIGGRVSQTPGTSQAYAVQVNRYFQVQAREGLTVVLKTETAGATVYGRQGTRTSELVLDGNDRKQDIIGLAGIAEGAPTTLLAYIFDGQKLVESAQFKLPANPIVERVTHEGVPTATPTPAPGPTPAPQVVRRPAPVVARLLNVSFEAPAMVALLKAEPIAIGADVTPAVAQRLLSVLPTLSGAERGETEAALRRMIRNNHSALSSASIAVFGAALAQPLSTSLTGPAGFLFRALARAEQPLSGPNAERILTQLKALPSDSDSTLREALLFSGDSLTPQARALFEDAVKPAFTPAHLSFDPSTMRKVVADPVDKPAHLKPITSDRVFTPEQQAQLLALTTEQRELIQFIAYEGNLTFGEDLRPARARLKAVDQALTTLRNEGTPRTLTNGVQAALPSQLLARIADAGEGTSIDLGQGAGNTLSARFDAASGDVIFELKPAQGEQPFTSAPVRVPLEALRMTPTIGFERVLS
jgi:hypothetical protein